jgi:hypothetical protein
MKRDLSISKSFRQEINLQISSVKHKKEFSYDRTFNIEGCVIRSA